jgi:hypothetical protein
VGPWKSSKEERGSRFPEHGPWPFIFPAWPGLALRGIKEQQKMAREENVTIAHFMEA